MSKETPPDSVPDNCVHCGCARHHHGMKAHAFYLCESLLHISKDSRHFGKWHRSLNCWRAEATALKEQLRQAHAALRVERAHLLNANVGRTHWDGCEKDHPTCAAIARIDKALASAPDGKQPTGE